MEQLDVTFWVRSSSAVVDFSFDLFRTRCLAGARALGVDIESVDRLLRCPWLWAAGVSPQLKPTDSADDAEAEAGPEIRRLGTLTFQLAGSLGDAWCASYLALLFAVP